MQIQEQKKSILLHVGDQIVYNDRSFMAMTKKARQFAIIVEFHKSLRKTTPMELSNGYTMNVDDIFMLHKRRDQTDPKKEEIISKELKLYRIAWSDARWTGQTKQDKMDAVSRAAQKAINNEMDEFVQTGGAKYAVESEGEEEDDEFV